VRVRLRRETTSGTVDFHDYLYEVERIGKNISGVVDLDLIHFPIDDQGRSLLALAVIDAVGNGIVIPTGRTDFSCDAGATIATNGIGGAGGGGGGYGVPIGQQGDPDGAIDNPIEPPLGAAITGASGDDGQPIEDDELSYDPGCAGAFIEWYLVNATGARTKVSEGVAASYIVKPSDIDKQVLGIGACPDPGSPTGYGTPVESALTEPVEPDLTQYQYARFVAFTPTAFTTQWVAFGGVGQEPFLYLAGLREIFSGAFGNVSGSSNTLAAWRSSVSARAIGATAGYGVGGVGGVPSAGVPIGTVFVSSDSEVTQTGEWQFTNDTIAGPEVTWDGRPDV
jgi:hypothetical protein